MYAHGCVHGRVLASCDAPRHRHRHTDTPAERRRRLPRDRAHAAPCCAAARKRATAGAARHHPRRGPAQVSVCVFLSVCLSVRVFCMCARGMYAHSLPVFSCSRMHLHLRLRLHRLFALGFSPATLRQGKRAHTRRCSLTRARTQRWYLLRDGERHDEKRQDQSCYARGTRLGGPADRSHPWPSLPQFVSFVFLLSSSSLPLVLAKTMPLDKKMES